jgi:hypothetical protein
MSRFVFPALIAIACAGTVYAVTREAPSDQEATVKLPVAANDAKEISPYLEHAAQDLGHHTLRAYDGSVYINVGDDKISFFREKNDMQMHVEFDSKFRHDPAQRDADLRALQMKGQAIFEHAVSLKQQDASQNQFASRAKPTPAG